MNLRWLIIGEWQKIKDLSLLLLRTNQEVLPLVARNVVTALKAVRSYSHCHVVVLFLAGWDRRSLRRFLERYKEEGHRAILVVFLPGQSSNPSPLFRLEAAGVDKAFYDWPSSSPFKFVPAVAVLVRDRNLLAPGVLTKGSPPFKLRLPKTEQPMVQETVKRKVQTNVTVVSFPRHHIVDENVFLGVLKARLSGHGVKLFNALQEQEGQYVSWNDLEKVCQGREKPDRMLTRLRSTARRVHPVAFHSFEKHPSLGARYISLEIARESLKQKNAASR